MRLVDAMKEFAWGPILPERVRGHPRIFLTPDAVESLGERARQSLKGDWLNVQAQAIANPAFQPEPACLCYLITGDDFYLGLVREQIRQVIARETWSYARPGKELVVTEWGGSPYDPSENKDLVMGLGLTSLAFVYDMMFSHLTPEERDIIREQLARNCRLTYDYYTQRELTWYYAQNHPYMPMVGMALAGYALYGEEGEAEDWLKLSGAYLQRVFRCNGADGWYYEGWQYWAAFVPYLVTYAEARYQMTGLNDALSAPLLRYLPTYVRHMLLPGENEAFDFGDCYPMYIPEFERCKLNAYDSEYYFNRVPWREVRHLVGGLLGLETRPEHFCAVPALDLMAARLQDENAQALAEHLRLRGHRGRRSFWSLLWRDPDLKPASDADGATGHYFDDHEVAIWRSGWEAKATAVAIKCGPPMGHRNAQNLREIPDLELKGWHAHPDAGSFILFSHGKFLCTDTGYTNPKQSAEHNVLLINGRGQDRACYEGFDKVPYERLDQIRFTRVDIQGDYMYAEADMTAAYPPELEMDRIERRFLATDGCIVIWDLLEASYPHDYVWLLHTDTDYEEIHGGYQTRNGDVALQVRFLQPEDVTVEVQKTVVIAHQHAPRGAGPAQERGMHLEAHQRGSACQYIACLTWGWRHEAVPQVDISIEDGRLVVLWQKDGQRMSLSISSMGGKVEVG